MSDGDLRKQLVELLEGRGAHIEVMKAITDFPVPLRAGRVAGVRHTPWQLLEHLRIAQWDILEFSRDAKHVSPAFPDGYWPATDEPPEANSWDASVAALRADLTAMQELVLDPATDLHARIQHGDGQTVLREALVLADHNAYHLGQMMLIRRALEAGQSV